MSILNDVAKVVNRPGDVERAFLLVITTNRGVQYRGSVLGHLKTSELSYDSVELLLWPERQVVGPRVNVRLNVDEPTDKRIFIAAPAIETVEIEWLDQ
jgi:hypothetical protein